GFNRQKNSGLSLEHVYSSDPEKWRAYYLLLQIAFILIQLVERGSLLRRLAQEAGRPPREVFGSPHNPARAAGGTARVRGVGGTLVRPPPGGEAAHRAGQLVGGPGLRSSPGRASVFHSGSGKARRRAGASAVRAATDQAE